VNTRALCMTVRSRYYRQRLARDLPDLEETLRAELYSRYSRGLTHAQLGGYIVRLDGNELFIELAPPISPGQLRLPGVESG